MLQANISAVFLIDSFCSKWAATILERKSTEYAFIGILFLVDSIVPHNIRKCCILATNVLDIDELEPDQILSTYKQQQSAERGFSFLKDPLFFTDSVFLKSSERIESLALIMGLCLLVYTLAQRHLRSRLI